MPVTPSVARLVFVLRLRSLIRSFPAAALLLLCLTILAASHVGASLLARGSHLFPASTVPLPAAAVAPALSIPVSGYRGSGSKGAAVKGAAVKGAPTATAAATIAKLPLSFEPAPDRGNGHPRFRARGNGFGVFLSPDEAVFVLRQGGDHSAAESGEGENPR